MPASYNDYIEEQRQREKEKLAKKNSLERQLKMWKNRQAELRKVGISAIDPAFVRRQMDKCSDEINRINAILSSI
jgi:hypothetical protein